MSKDIRSFFSVHSTKGKATKTSPTIHKESPPSTKRKSRKRPVIVSDSEDDEPVLKTPKRDSQRIHKGNSISPKSTTKKEQGSSKYFSMPKDKVNSIFGTSPVKQVPAKSIPKAIKSSKIPPEVHKELEGLENIDDWDDEDFFNANPSALCSKEEVGHGTRNKSQESPAKTRKATSPVKRKSQTPTKLDSQPVTKAPSPKKRVLSPSPVKREQKQALKSSLSTSSLQQQSSGDLWVDRYRPKTIKQIIGQQGENSNVQKLLRWLQNWHKNHSGEKKLARPAPWVKDNTGAWFKAALLTGPPGIGKTTTAHLVCQELGLDIVEFNASDTRSKKLLSLEITELVTSQTLANFAHSTNSTPASTSRVLIMDEVDGMAGNEDRGGIQELISIIKNSKVPVICMANDRSHPKIRSLVNYCFDLRFSSPRAEQIKGAMRSICFKEGIKLEPSVLDGIIANAKQDVRLILNCLSVLAANVDDPMLVSAKDIKMGPWDVVRKIFSESERKNMTIHDKCDLFFHDYSITPLFVQENYLAVQPHSEISKTKAGKMKSFAVVATSLSYGDLIESAIRTHNAWSLLPVQAIFSSLIPGDVLEGHISGMINFPAWFGKNSKKNKMDRLTQEIQSHTRLRISGSKEAVCLDYARKLRDLIVHPLIKHGSEGVETALEALRDYCLLREDIESLSELTLWPGMKDPFAGLEPKLKAAFTRAYNKNPVLSPFSTSTVVKGGRGKGGGGAESEEFAYGNEDVIEEADEVEDDDLTKDGMILAKKKKVETPKASKERKGKKDAPGPSKGRKGRK